MHNKIKKIIGIFLSCLVLIINYSTPVRTYANLPKEIILYKGSDYNLEFGLPVKYNINSNLSEYVYENNDYQTSAIINTKDTSEVLINIAVFGILSKKEIKIKTLNETYLVPGGDSIGVSLKTEGILVVGFCDVIDSDGNMLSPSKKAGLQIGDAIINADGKKIKSALMLTEIIDKSEGNSISIEVLRNKQLLKITIEPKKDYQDNKYHIGIWAREGSSGIGTLTYIDPITNKFGALGHPVTDNDTGEILDLDEGWLYKSEITAIYKGTSGMPGELMGQFYKNKKYLAKIIKNCKYGLFGNFTSEYDIANLIKIMPRNDVKTGSAILITTLDGEGQKEFACEIQKINSYSQDTTKNMIIKITDENLLKLTGGIVQGMSGSPIIQDGKLVGAITHVFVNDPTMGHAIFIENMLLAQNIN